MKVKNIHDCIIGSFGILVSLVIYFIIIPVTVLPLEKVNSMFSPIVQRTDLVPKIWTVFLIIGSIGLLIESLLVTEPQKNKKIDFKEIFLVGALSSVIVVYISLLPIAGFIFTSTICLVTSLWLFGYRNIIKSILFSILINVVVYLFLVNFIHVTF